MGLFELFFIAAFLVLVLAELSGVILRHPPVNGLTGIRLKIGGVDYTAQAGEPASRWNRAVDGLVIDKNGLNPAKIKVTPVNAGAALRFAFLFPPPFSDGYTVPPEFWKKTVAGAFAYAAALKEPRPGAVVPKSRLAVEVTAADGSRAYYRIILSDTAAVPVFDINNLPPVSANDPSGFLVSSLRGTPWNQNGEIVPLPNPFIKADGTLIDSPSQWPERRAEIAKLLQYYLAGHYPAQPDSVVINTGGINAGYVPGENKIKITVTAGGVSADDEFSLWLPEKAPNGFPPSPGNTIPFVVHVSFARNSITDPGPQALLANGYAVIMFYPPTLSVKVEHAFVRKFRPDIPFVLSDKNTPSALILDAWHTARFIDAVEKGAGGGVIDPGKAVIAGMSRMGKLSLYAGAFAESMSGRRFAVVMPAVTCAGGTPIERFTATTASTRLWYLKDIDTRGDAPLRLRAAPGTPGAYPEIINSRNLTGSGIESGLQTNAHGRVEENGGWYAARFQDFIELHKDWQVNLYRADAGESFGITGTCPFDAHFLASLVAPRALLIEDSWDYWSNGEGAYLDYLAVKEVYDFIGAEKNAGIRIYDTGHIFPLRSCFDLVDFANMYFNRSAGSRYGRLTGAEVYPEITGPDAFQDKDPAWYKAAEEPFAAHTASWYDPRNRDPSGYMEYTKLNWACPLKAPGSSVAENVYRYFTLKANRPKVLPGSRFIREDGSVSVHT